MTAIEGWALVLEPLEIGHAEAMFAGLRNPALYTYIDESPIKDLASLREIYRRRALGGPSDGSQIWLNWMIYAPQARHYLGYVQATIDRNSHRAEIAYVVFQDFWRKGVARRAVAMMMERLEAERGIREYRAVVDVRNQASIALLQALGFRPIADADTAKQNIIFILARAGQASCHVR